MAAAQVLAAPALMTAEELYARPDLDRVELVNGEVVEKMPPGYRHGRIAGRITARLAVWVEEHGAGEVLTEAGYRLRRRPDIVRSPDVSFLSVERQPEDDETRFFDGPPDIAIEVVSPNDEFLKVMDKVGEYLAAGTRLIWVVDPQTRTIMAHGPGLLRVYREGETLSGAPVLPDFEIAVNTILDR